MKKDYSEYKKDDYDIYLGHRSNHYGVKLDYSINQVRFSPEERKFTIDVNPNHEYYAMIDDFKEYYEEEAIRLGESPKKLEFEEAYIKETNERVQKYREELQKKYNYWSSWDPLPPGEIGELPAVNALSGAQVYLNYGEGILDFIYADFQTPLKKLTSDIVTNRLMEVIFSESDDESESEEPKKIFTSLQDIVERFNDYVATFDMIYKIAYSSLYSAICPPVFNKDGRGDYAKIKWYGNYLLMLQREYKELIEFCYDEEFYPEVLGSLYPSERFYLYRKIHKLPSFFRRKEELHISMVQHDNNSPVMPYGMTDDERLARRLRYMEPTNEHYVEFAEKFGLKPNEVKWHTCTPFFLNFHYMISSIAEMLELEFTKMLEQNVRFRKCKRCGKYFVMKGNYDTNYCDRIAEGETRNCQELAAIENYKAKIADNKAIPIYNKYYKRYAARVKVNQIKEPDFKKWKYQAMTKRDECAEGIISVAEYIEWMEAAFPNRKPKTESKS